MEDTTVIRLALIWAEQAEIEMAKLDNLIRIERGLHDRLNYPPAYFEQKAQELRELAHKHRDEL